MADYDSLAVSYKITPKVLDATTESRHLVVIYFENEGNHGEQMRYDQQIYLDGDWHKFEVPVSEFKQPVASSEISEFNGENVNSLSFSLFFVIAPEFDVEVKFDNIRLTPIK